MVDIFANKTHKDAVIPTVAYEGTSACFDITCVQDTIIRPGQSNIVPCGLRLTIDENAGYYMRIALRSSYGLSKDMICHPGIVDGGYTGGFGVKVYNVGTHPYTIEKGKRFSQIEVLKKNPHRMIELNNEMFAELESRQKRGKGREGSSDKK